MRTLLIDGNNLLYRTFWAANYKAKNSSPGTTAATYIFLRALKSYADTISSDGHSFNDAPSGSGRYINELTTPRGASGAIVWTSVSSPSTVGGVTTWTAQGTIHISRIDLGATTANRDGINLNGDFKITKNSGSPLYVIQDHDEEATNININGAGNAALTRLSLGIQLAEGGDITATGGWNPSFTTNIAGIFET